MSKHRSGLPASVNGEVVKMSLAISRKQLSIEQALQHIARYCLADVIDTQDRMSALAACDALLEYPRLDREMQMRVVAIRRFVSRAELRDAEEVGGA